MGSKSKSKSSTRTTTNHNNFAMDASATNGEGLQILDSIVVNSDAAVVTETINAHAATFETMMAESTIQLDQLLGLGTDLLTMADRQQISFQDGYYKQLETGVQLLQEARADGKYVIDFVDMATNRTFNLADDVVEGNQDFTTQALELVADVKTENYADSLRTISTLMVVFALGSLWIINRK